MVGSNSCMPYCEGFVHAGLLDAGGRPRSRTRRAPNAPESPKFVLPVVSAIRLPAVPNWQTGQ